MRQTFEQFMKQREEAAREYVQGNPEPLSHLAARTSPATFFGPNGDVYEGAEEVLSTYTQDAAAFAPNSETHFEILHLQEGDTLGYWVGFQHASVYFKGKTDATPMKLRVTEIYRRHGDDWKLIHRHADMPNFGAT